MATQAQYDAASQAIDKVVQAALAKLIADAGMMGGFIENKIAEYQTTLTAVEQQAAHAAVDAALGVTP